MRNILVNVIWWIGTILIGVGTSVLTNLVLGNYLLLPAAIFGAGVGLVVGLIVYLPHIIYKL